MLVLPGISGHMSEMDQPWLPADKKGEEFRSGTLYIVATPIGNLADITLRALRILAAADVVACEDTRRTGLLLQAYGIRKPLMSCFAHNEEQRSDRILTLLREGRMVALVSDAGMPGISDPGARLIKKTVAAGIPLSVAPGASAGLTALVASGLDTDTFAFGGFFPRERKGQVDWLRQFGAFAGTVIFYESPKRIKASLAVLQETWGERRCCVARELTKRFEECIRGSLAEVREALAAAGGIKGEIVVVVEGCRDGEGLCVSDEDTEALAKELLAGGLSKKETSRRLAEVTGRPARELYTWLVQLTSSNS